MQQLIQIAIVLFVIAFIGNKFQKEIFGIIAEYKKKKKEWDKDENNKL